MLNAAIRVAVVDAIDQLTGRSAALISDDDRLDDLGVDSMVAVRLLVAIEDRLEALLPDGSEAGLAGARTVGQLVECVAEAFTTSEADEQPESAARLS